jgi:hypothetical protein
MNGETIERVERETETEKGRQRERQRAEGMKSERAKISPFW